MYDGALTFKKPGTLIVRRIFLKAPGSVPSSPSACVTCSSIALTLAPTILTKACRHKEYYQKKLKILRFFPTLCVATPWFPPRKAFEFLIIAQNKL